MYILYFWVQQSELYQKFPSHVWFTESGDFVGCVDFYYATSVTHLSSIKHLIVLTPTMSLNFSDNRTKIQSVVIGYIREIEVFDLQTLTQE